MATYYVRTDGNNSNTGTSSGTGGAWATVAHALGGTGTASGVTGGDTIYIAPGKYSGLTIGVAPSSMLYVIGDPSGAQFGYTIAPGPVHISYVLDRVSGAYSHAISATSKDYISLKNLVIGGIITSACHNWIIDSCHSYIASSINFSLNMTFTANINANTVIKNSTFFIGGYNAAPINVTFGTHSTAYTSSFRIDNVSLIGNQGNNDISISCANATGIVLSNIYALKTISVTGTVANQAKIINSIVSVLTGSVGGNFVEDYNVLVLRTGGNRTNVSSSLNSVLVNAPLIYGDTMAQSGALSQSSYQPANQVFNQLIGYGTTTDAPASDYFGNAFGTPMTIGIAKSATLTGAGVYSATERNASTITIAPGSTSQSIELYLGATGLTASTSGLSARYNRTRTASQDIPLVARTIGQAWTSGGFAEVDATNMPGVYRLDVPDAALAAGADDVTIVVRGASGTNGAVMTIKLSSGGLTAAQTASAVWDASITGYTYPSNFGGLVNEISGVTSVINNEVLNIPSNVWDEAKAGHTIPNTFGDYLDTKVSTGADTSRIQLRQGPFLIKQNATEGLITEVNQFLSTVPNMEIVLIDSSGGAVSVAGSTLVLRVRNQAGTAVVNNVTPTVAYADGGVIRWTPNLSWNALSVTTPGTYRIIVERTMGTTTTTFGPFLVQLSSG
jgi:hypothetical protein